MSAGAGAATPRDIAVVVVTYQSASTIEDCLRRLRLAQGVGEIRVVDNDSRDGTLEIIQRHAARDPRVHFIANPDNPGFSVACNQGARDSTAPWLAFVNPDLLVQADSLRRLQDHALALGGEGLLGVHLVDEAGVADGAARRRDPDFAAMVRYPLRAPKLAVAPDPTQALQPLEAVSGALMLVPRSLFQRVGGFDEGYRLHAEDLDLCRKVRLAGGQVGVANDIAVVHLRGVSSRSRPFFVEWHKHRGLWRYFRKFEAPRRSWLMRRLVWAVIWLHALAQVPRLLRSLA
ncbi:glycosyltransferase family 2 protein [Pseudoxanthomonas composti]|uniref:Glycosyltransferase family 2 protein n=1 Tax=Pseudoxanthomonas composti TaxID=2137479 RepID=A0A4Q1JSJ9_9GAMM|nr:glycosyltransferase family 2 protein [Pseudoxanthomonas composti]RXR01395.1 glycosyltransferase family 2 protein [Pseudoxanthomonas composti]